MSDGEFLYHTPCPACGSKDANSVYSSGTTYCFSCETWGVLDGDLKETKARGRSVSKEGLLGGLRPIEKTTRSIKEETFKKYSYMYGSYKGKNCHVAPYYFKGNLVAQHIRTPDKEFAWVGEAKELELFGQHLWKNSGDFRKRIIVTEGEIDCMSVSQAFNNKWPVVSVPSGAQSASKYIKQNLEFLEGYDEVVLAFDSDEPGKKASQECALLFTPGKVRVADWSPYKDANDILKEGKPSEITQRIFDAKSYRPDGIISGQDLWDIINQPLIPGYSIQYPQMNQLFRGLRKTEVYMFTAGSGIGKSTIVNEIAYHLMMEHNLKIGVIALEENKKRTAERYLSIFLNQPLHITREGITEEKLREAFTATVGSGRMYLYDHFGSLDSHNLMSKLRYMVKGLGVDFIVLDHISIVVSGLEDSGGDERKDIDRLMTNLKSLAEEANVGVLAVVHLKRKDKGKSYNEGGQVSLSDLRGSGALEQLSDGVIALERNQQGKKPNISKVRLLKNRYTGETGEADLLEYHRDTGRLLVCSEGNYDFEEEETAEDLGF